MVEGRLFPSALVMRRGIKQPLQDAVERTVLTSLAAIVQTRVNPEKRQPVSTSDSEGTRWLVEERVTELESWLSQQCDASGMQDNVVNPLSAPGWQDREMIEQCASPWGPEFRCRTCYSQDGCAAH